MITAFKKYLITLKLSPVSRKLYGNDVRKFLHWLQASKAPSEVQPGLDEVGSPLSYSTYLAHLRSQATAPSMLKRTLASLKQFGTFIALTYSVPNPTASPLRSTIHDLPSNHDYLTHFTNYLNQDHLSPLTIKSYKSDVTRYLDYSRTHLASTELAQVLTDKNINKYLNHLRQSLSSLPSTIERKSQSLARFTAWYSDVYSPTLMADNNTDPLHSRSVGALHSGSVETVGALHSGSVSSPIRNFISLAILLLFISSLAIFGYRQFSRDASLTAAYPSTPVTPNRQLSFQGRLENAGGTPITTATDMVFKLFTASTAGTELYSSGTCSIDPDQDGVFNTQIGSTCGAAIAATVFTENSGVWLEVTIVAETLAPRQQIATVAYALNSETLQGFPISATVSAIRNTVVPMNQFGEIIVGEQSPRLTGVSGTFQISAPALSIITATGTNGNITLAPDGTGQINATGNTTSTNFFNISNAQLTTGSLFTGTVGNANTGFKLLDLLSGVSPTSKFSVSDAGNVTLAGDLIVSGTNATLPNNSISPNEIFTTSQTDEYCLTYETTGGTWEWQTCGGGPGSGSNWRIASGALSPLNDTLDLLVGNIATASAKFSVNATSGNVALAGDLTITGDDLFMTTNTANYFLMADGTNYNPTSPADARTGLGIAAGGTGDIWVEKAGDTMTGALTNTLATGNSLVWDTNTLIVDATNDRVGIGNTAPVGKLDVSGAVTGKALVILNETGDQNILTASASGVTRMNLTTEGYVEAQRFADLANTTYYLDPAAAGVSLALASGSLTSGVVDGATAVAFTLNSTNTLSTQGSKLLSLQNNGTEKMYLDKDGNLYVSGTVLSGNGTSMLLTNKSGGTVANRSVVVLDTSNNTSFTTTTTPYSKSGFGVVVGVGLGVANDADGDGVCDANDICMVAYGGSVNVTVKNATTAVKGDYLFTSDTAGSAVASAKQYDGLVGIVDDTTNSASGYLRMIFKVQPQVTAAAAIDKGTKHNEYWLYADQYQAVGEGANTDTNLLQRGLAFDTFTDTTKTDSANTTASLDTATQRTGLIGGQTLATSTTDNDGQTYLGSNTVNDTYYYDRTPSGAAGGVGPNRDSSPAVQVELGIDPNWYNGVTLSVATTSAQFSQNSVITQPNPNLSTSYNGSLIKVTGTDSTPRTIYITIKSPTTFDWTNYQGDAATAVTMTPGTAQTLGGTGVSAKFTNARYNTGDVFKIASWFIEAESATRGAKQQFPERSNVIATASSVDIIDADTQKLWMRFSQGTSYAIGVDANNDPSSANMLNGKAYISTNGSSATGLYTLDFVHDAVFKQNATDYRLSDTALYGRNAANTYNVINTSNILVNITANDVSASVIPNQPTQNMTVSGWGYIQGNNTVAINESVNLPYKFNNTPNVTMVSAGLGISVPTKLDDCVATTYNFVTQAYNQRNNSFGVYIREAAGTAISSSYYACYTWTATGQVSPRQYVAVATGATNGGITFINETDQSAVNITTTTGYHTEKIKLLDNGNWYTTTPKDDHTEYWFNSGYGLPPSSTTVALGRNYYYYNASIPSITPLLTTAMNSLEVTKGTSTIDGKSNTIYLGTATGLTVLQEKQSGATAGDGSDESSGSVKYYTKDYISEEMVGNISTMLPFSSNGSLSMTDVSVGNITYTNTGSVTSITGVRGVGADFGSANSSKYITAGAKVINVGQKSVGFWLKTSQTSSGMILDSNGVDSSLNGFFTRINATANKITFQQNKAVAGQQDYAIISNASINDGNWHFIVNTWSGDTQSNGVKIYIDGNLDNQNTATSFANNTATNNLRIGAISGASPSNYYSGNLDEVFATSAVLTAGQIKHMYQVGYRALQSHATTLGGGAADTNQQLGGTTNVIGAAQPDLNNQFMYVGTNSTTLGAVSKIDLNSDTNIKTYNSSANVPTGGPLLIDEDTKSLAVGYNLEAVGSATTGVKTMGVDNNATATSGNFIGKTVTTAESFTQAYLWAQYTLDASDASNTIEVWASNDGGSNYSQCNLTNTDSSRSPSEYEYFCQFNASGSSLKTKFVMARGSTKTNTWVSKYGIAWIDSNAVAGSANGSGLFTGSNATVANGSYIDVAHNQNSNDVVTNGWVYNTGTSKWEVVDNTQDDATGGTITHSGGYTIHTFTSSGTFTPNSAGNVEYLVVGGGGGGGGHSTNDKAGGGGGAGGFRTATGFAVIAQGYTVTVGGGGAGGTGGQTTAGQGTNGNDSVFSTITSTGGGGGGSGVGGSGQSYHAGKAGGSGGGATGGTSGGAGNTPSTSPSQGSTGGNATDIAPSAGGGGASAAGGINSGTTGGNGGAGTASSISGSSVTYAGGGGGGADGTAGTGGAGGGAAGALGTASSNNGSPNTGGGGGGAGTGLGSRDGGAGGSGIVIVRYLTNSLSAFKITQQDANTVRLYNYSGAAQNLRLDVITGGLGRNAGTVSLAPVAADVDSQASTNSLWINKTGSGGNLLKLQTGGADMTLVNNLGDITGGITTLDGSTTANGAGTASTTLILTSATNFNVGNYVKVSSTDCVTGVNVCYAKITNIATNTLTISPALTWANGSAVVEVHVPELGGIDTSQALANRYGRGYFVDGIVAGNGSTYFTDNLISFGGGSKIQDASGKLQLQAGGTGTGSTGTGSIYFLNSSGASRGRFDTTASDFNATGGTIATASGYTTHTFTSSGTFTPGLAGNVEYLVVAGGGGGGSHSANGVASGGGGGGYRTNVGGTKLAISDATTITVGSGGGINTGTNGSKGGNSSIGALVVATGGGPGLTEGAAGSVGNGGSGGGAGSTSNHGTGNEGGYGGSPSIPEGFNGGDGGGGNAGAAGGGAGGVGGNGTASGTGGNGGNGLSNSISGSAVTYAGGGSGGSYNGSDYHSGSGGAGGGGKGADINNGTNATAGTANTGGGGGGGAKYSTNDRSGAVGGSGIVIIRYPTTTYGTLYLNSTNTSSSDLAEYYVAGDKTISAGDVVSISNTKVLDDGGEEVTNQGVMRKSAIAYDGKLLGIISTNPGVLLGSIDGDTGKTDKRMLALSGRVPVKIDPDSEPIEAGDFLTSSDKPGLAMKATKAGYTVGKALENWNPGGPDRIEAFVNLGYHDPDLQLTDTGDIVLTGDSPDTYAVSTPTGITSRIGAFASATIAKLTAGLTRTNELQVDTISPLAPDQPIAINGPVVISSQTSDTPELLVEGEIEATTISARLAKLDEIQADTITARNIVADTISANHIEGLDAKIASLSGNLSDAQLGSITDRIKARLALLTGNIATAKDIPQESLDSQTPNEAGGEVGPTTASDSASLASADIDFATINNYLAVIGQAVMTDLDVTGHLYAANINSKTGTLALGDNTLIINSMGEVMINGDLTVSGRITASELNLERLNVYNEDGIAVATIDASGSANLAALTTQMITIASSSEAQTSQSGATPSGLLTSMTTSNATAGESVLISPNTQLTINSPYITPNSLVYLTPTTNTDNKVLFVKSKDEHSFTVAIDQPATSDISFNWWIIQLGKNPTPNPE